MASGIAIQHALNALEQVRIDDGVMLALKALLAVHDAAEVDPVPQKMEQSATAEGSAAGSIPGAGDPQLRADALQLEFALQGMDRAKLEVARENMAYRCRFLLVHPQLSGTSLGKIVSQRQVATHPHALGL